MEEAVECLNETAEEQLDTLGFVLEYVVERAGDSWVVRGYASWSIIPDVHVGDLFETGAFVRCSRCGAIRILFDGQAKFCLTCDADWEE